VSLLARRPIMKWNPIANQAPGACRLQSGSARLKLGKLMEKARKRLDEPVLFSEQGAGRYRVGVVTLNTPETLNALDLRMLQLIADRLGAWREQADIACVALQSRSERAFSAGGDVKSLIFGLGREPGLDFARGYFTYEYFVDYFIHVYPKPVLCWADGITMGGGIGIMNGASHRVVTERTLMAMPEITIGFFPDVGATYFLNRLPRRLGLFLGLTGARFDGRDAVAIGMADGLVGADKKAEFFAALIGLPWTGAPEKDRDLLSRHLTTYSGTGAAEDSTLLRRLDRIRELTDREGIDEIDAAFRASPTQDPWLRNALHGYCGGSPTSAGVIFRQLTRGENLPLREAFRREWDMAINLCARPDFYEGVRARLLDRDNRPRWRPVDLREVKTEDIERCFTAPNPDPHPLYRMMEQAGPAEVQRGR